MHSISPVGQPEGVDTGSTADIENGRGRWWQIAKHDLLCARKLKLPRSRREASFLRNLLVVAGDLPGEIRPLCFLHGVVIPDSSCQPPAQQCHEEGGSWTTRNLPSRGLCWSGSSGHGLQEHFLESRADGLVILREGKVSIPTANEDVWRPPPVFPHADFHQDLSSDERFVPGAGGQPTGLWESNAKVVVVFEDGVPPILRG